jgi:hypothetical protein
MHGLQWDYSYAPVTTRRRRRRMIIIITIPGWEILLHPIYLYFSSTMA